MTSAASLTALSKTPTARSSSESARRATATLAGAQGRWTTLDAITSLATRLASRHRTLRTAAFKCPAWPGRKPAKPEVLVTNRLAGRTRTRAHTAHFQASKALRLREDQLTYFLRYGIVIRSGSSRSAAGATRLLG